MLHSEANDQSTEPFQSGLERPWQGFEEEPHQEEQSREKRYWGERQSHQPNLEKNTYWSERPSYELPTKESAQSTWQESPPRWNTSGKLPVTPTVKAPVRGSHTMAILALTMVIASVFGVGLFAGWTFSKDGIG